MYQLRPRVSVRHESQSHRCPRRHYTTQVSILHASKGLGPQRGFGASPQLPLTRWSLRSVVPASDPPIQGRTNCPLIPTTWCCDCCIFHDERPLRRKSNKTRDVSDFSCVVEYSRACTSSALDRVRTRFLETTITAVSSHETAQCLTAHTVSICCQLLCVSESHAMRHPLAQAQVVQELGVCQLS